jgi:hypothetical protein
VEHAKPKLFNPALLRFCSQARALHNTASLPGR